MAFKPITGHIGNPTCGAVNLDKEYSRKSNLWIWMKNIPGNPTYGSG
jgi:hypothetical protein